jgi:hypothetical protein
LLATSSIGGALSTSVQPEALMLLRDVEAIVDARMVEFPPEQIQFLAPPAHEGRLTRPTQYVGLNAAMATSLR